MESPLSPRHSHRHALIVAGGAGTRLWPLSRAARPKQFQPLLSDGKSPLRHMAELVAPGHVPWERLSVLTVPEFGDLVREQLPEMPAENLLTEPERRDNGPAVVLGMQRIRRRDPDATVALLWSDHAIGNAAEFGRAFDAAFAASEAHPERMVVTGATPTEPDPSLGYIHRGAAFGRFGAGDGACVHSVAAFVEKPERTVAEGFVASGEHLWNVGYKTMHAGSFLARLRAVRPELGEALDSLEAADTGEEIAAAYSGLPKESIEYLFTQHLDDLLVVAGDLGWSDLGSWPAVHTVQADAPGESLHRGPVAAVGCEDVLVYAGEGKPVVLVGVRGLTVVDAGDCILVLDKSSADAMKQAHAAVKECFPHLL
jgi:mannose-1-phosphate guanylyltransferase